MSRTWMAPFFVATACLLIGLIADVSLGDGAAPGARAAEVHSGGARAPSAGPLLINEVLYDATGADEGGEFVELLLAGGEPLALSRVSLESGNGARPGDWQEIWRGIAGDTLAPAARGVIGGARIQPPPRWVAELGLQNGPDACRVLIDGVVVDVVGWGPLESPEFFAGEPAPDVPAGTSLGRVPDGRSTGSNRADFVALGSPSPGAPNRRPPPLRLRSRGHRSDAGERPQLWVDWTLEAEEGTPDLLPRAVELSVAPCAALPGRAAETLRLAGSGPWTGELALGPLDPGPLDLCMTWVAVEPPADSPESRGDTLRIAARAGPGPLKVNEFLYRPSDGGPEWIELVNTSSDSLALDRYALSDGRLETVSLDGASRLAPGEMMVVAEEAVPGPARVLVLGSRWPTLNDSGEPVADRIHLVDESGRTSDDVGYRGSWAPAGLSVERVALEMASADEAAWSASPLGPTPGRVNGAAREFPPGRGFLRIERASLSPAAANTVILFFAEPLRDGVLTVHAMDGRMVRRFAGAALAGRRFIPWDGRDDSGARLDPGLYLVTVAGEPARERSDMPPLVAGRATFIVAP